MDRTELEVMAREVCPASLWYDLMDCLNETSDQELMDLIADAANGVQKIDMN